VVAPTQLAIAKTPDGATITAGQAATFTITVTNSGPTAAGGVVITDPLPVRFYDARSQLVDLAKQGLGRV